MIDESIRCQIVDTLTHKKIIMDVGLKMCDYLFKNDLDELARELLDRIIIHDNSKFTEDELYSLSSIGCKRGLKDPNVTLSPEQQRHIKTHWQNNKHHPEYFKDMEDMREIDIIEMCCDWCARSIQYKTDLLEFIRIRQENRFHFPENIYEKIMKYCNILLDN